MIETTDMLIEKLKARREAIKNILKCHEDLVREFEKLNQILWLESP